MFQYTTSSTSLQKKLGVHESPIVNRGDEPASRRVRPERSLNRSWTVHAGCIQLDPVAQQPDKTIFEIYCFDAVELGLIAVVLAAPLESAWAFSGLHLAQFAAPIAFSRLQLGRCFWQ